MIVTFWTDLQVAVNLLPVDDLFTGVAFDPETLWYFDFFISDVLIFLKPDHFFKLSAVSY